MCTEEAKLVLDYGVRERDHEDYIGHRNPMKFLLISALVENKEFYESFLQFNEDVNKKIVLIQNKVDQLISLDSCN